MHNTRWWSAGALGLFLSVLSAQATLASLVITAQAMPPTAAVGDMIDVDIRIAGLGDHVSPSLGAFDIGLAYDPAILRYDGITSGSFLGNIPGEVVGATFVSSGDIRFSLMSLLSPSELNALQPSSFSLFSVAFKVLGLGVSPLTLAVLGLADELGQPLQASTQNGAITAVPEPQGAVLIGSGVGTFLGLALKTRRGLPDRRDPAHRAT